MLLINCSNREENCYRVLNDIKKDNDKLISLSNKKMDFCLGCYKCKERLDNYCVLDDYITENVYKEIIDADNIVLASPIYMSNINGILKNLIDRLLPFYNHQLLKNKTIYLVLTGGGSKDYNKDEIEGIINYFKGISEWLYFNFIFLDYFEDNNPNYNNQIETIKRKIQTSNEGMLRKYKIDEEGKMYEEEIKINLPDPVNYARIIMGVTKLLDLKIPELNDNSKRIEEANATYYYNPIHGGKSVIVADDGTYLAAGSAMSFEDLLKEFNNGKRNGNFIEEDSNE